VERVPAVILVSENLNPRLNVSGPSTMLSLDTGIVTVLLVEPVVNTALTGDEVKSLSTKTTRHCYYILTHGNILLADGGVRRDGITSTLEINGLARLPDTRDTVTGMNPASSLPLYRSVLY